MDVAHHRDDFVGLIDGSIRRDALALVLLVLVVDRLQLELVGTGAEASHDVVECCFAVVVVVLGEICRHVLIADLAEDQPEQLALGLLGDRRGVRAGDGVAAQHRRQVVVVGVLGDERLDLGVEGERLVIAGVHVPVAL